MMYLSDEHTGYTAIIPVDHDAGSDGTTSTSYSSSVLGSSNDEENFVSLNLGSAILIGVTIGGFILCWCAYALYIIYFHVQQTTEQPRRSGDNEEEAAPTKKAKRRFVSKETIKQNLVSYFKAHSLEMVRHSTMQSKRRQ